MKKLLLVFLITLFPIISFASPFLVCNPQEGVTHYKLTGPSWVPTQTPAQPDGSIRMDVNEATNGVSEITVAACTLDPIWGEACSSYTPFPFTRPTPPGPIVGVRLAP